MVIADPVFPAFVEKNGGFAVVVAAYPVGSYWQAVLVGVDGGRVVTSWLMFDHLDGRSVTNYTPVVGETIAVHTVQNQWGQCFLRPTTNVPILST